MESATYTRVRDDGPLIVVCDVFNVNQTESNIKLDSFLFLFFRSEKWREERYNKNLKEFLCCQGFFCVLVN